MKKLLHCLLLATTAIVLLSLQGCLKDDCRRTYTLYQPIYKTLKHVRAEMKSTAPASLENTGKLNVFGNYIFLNEVGKGIHVIDNAVPASPKNIGFINIPNNVDLAIKGSYLYADSYSDIIVFDISNPTNVKPVKFMDNVMKEKNVYWYPMLSNPDSIKVVVGYTTKDTTVDCNTYNTLYTTDNRALDAALASSSYAAAPSVGTGGSMASFTIINNFLYTVSASSLYTIDISNPINPFKTADRNMGWGIETIYPFQNKLFIGSRTGMFIYDLANPANPVQQGQFNHVRSCDPVIADGQYAYVTLRGGTACNSTINELNVIDVSNLSNPVLKTRRTLTNPHGLAKDGNTLMICDGKDGLKIYDAADPLNLKLVKTVAGLETFDVIAMNRKAIVVAKDGLYQYDYSDASNPSLISKISVNKK
ncbi:MAG TPA: hypothetical protein VMR70_01400 [Flavisolibacter sp.]|nr:hypothetical protein [Flavisolibacter sp.]